MHNRRFVILSGCAAALVAGQARAQTPTLVLDGLALGGMDPVTYRDPAGPMLGDAMFSLHWKGARWRFASQQNQATFERNPMAHAPAFGGYCAFALAHGSLAVSDPTVFSVLNDRIFLNQSRSVKQRWLERRDTYITAADDNWPGILG